MRNDFEMVLLFLYSHGIRMTVNPLEVMMEIAE